MISYFYVFWGPLLAVFRACLGLPYAKCAALLGELTYQLFMPHLRLKLGILAPLHIQVLFIHKTKHVSSHEQMF